MLRHWTSNTYDILGFTTAHCQTMYYAWENHEVDTILSPPSADILNYILDDVQIDGWIPEIRRFNGHNEKNISREKVIELCQTDTDSLFWYRSTNDSPAQPNIADWIRARMRGQAAALTKSEWKRSNLPDRSRGLISRDHWNLS